METIKFDIYQNEELSVSSSFDLSGTPVTAITIKGYGLLERLTEIVEGQRMTSPSRVLPSRVSPSQTFQPTGRLSPGSVPYEEFTRQRVSPGRISPPRTYQPTGRVSPRRLSPVRMLPQQYEVVDVVADFPEYNEYRSTMSDFDDVILDYIKPNTNVAEAQFIDDETLRLLFENKSDADIVISLLNNKCINNVNLKAYHQKLINF